MTKPIIGIPMNRLTSDDEHYTGLPIFYTHEGFPKGLIKAGGTPIFFPLTHKAETEYYLDLVDAVIFTGGQDLSPHLYGEEPGFKLQNISHERDIFEMAVFHSAWKRKLPILGVCRGMQLMNVSLGGSLYQDLSENPDVRIQHVQKSATNIATHSIQVKPNSWISQSYFDGDLVNSYHHQGVKKVADALQATAWSPDGVVEAIEAKDDDHFAVGVQFHPEWHHAHGPSEDFFKGFIDTIQEIKG
ncbi:MULTISPECIES: gamma-glutamyl-gamma-aminobutyrate hydrolase family protein [unclassified Aerococcus]|uniref:gamma-glutamyl-gamma-aminobutyrate hydrolase family protein n=1 Tax=unclassified Aerococcus TaxID=2618060 RepID=UPI0008A29453|nr:MULTISPECIES: gamma-glutamyl-gamma-aminobutyrate hydrolase family protein [unclassified Aerococcus]MDK6369442.1 gamma-glutamyl-gamma-aminobutyrate hydrolase family protein [Aerococcus sp. UMB9870]MDK6680505.1 gamma-glutamyl-gamma-aminobutyrate hydrolase family protein [Aerococcus sp. UMB8608]MDK6686695.1 gamma-glutamyl-gamma-aminobutyrate hydrolase family protein [Aerococcus sp. UMB8623]MDK6940452.1 gamma-glutamyl-gamma-aminobutyrate hydrolase family protein [Aerococcus sp. UMB8487]OFK15434